MLSLSNRTSARKKKEFQSKNDSTVKSVSESTLQPVKMAIDVPPQFYDEALSNWNKKFETATATRKLNKAHLLKTFGCSQQLGTKNQNIT